MTTRNMEDTMNMRSQKPESGSLKRSLAVLWLLASGFWLVGSSTLVSAKPTQDDVFKSIQDSVGERTEFDFRPVFFVAGGGALVLLLVAVAKHRQPRAVATGAAAAAAAARRPLNHPGRLIKQLSRDVPLKPAELKQLKMLAESIEGQAGASPNPISLLLCPSLLAKGLKAGPPKLDRRIVAQIVRKMQSQ